MLRTQRLVGALRLLLALSFVVLLALQLRVLPAVYDDWVRDAPELTGTGWTLPAAIAGLLCVQAVVVCTWRLLSLVAQDRIFSADAQVWVDVVVAALAVAELVLLALLGYVLVPGGPSSQAGGVLLLLLVAVAVVGLLVVVLRALLRQATVLRVELEAVV